MIGFPEHSDSSRASSASRASMRPAAARRMSPRCGAGIRRQVPPAKAAAAAPTARDTSPAPASATSGDGRASGRVGDNVRLP